MDVSLIKQAVLNIRREYRLSVGLTSRQINNGICDEFADELFALFPDGDTYWGEDHPSLFRPYFTPYEVKHKMGKHCFFGIEGIYFDSESPNGVDNPALLPFYKREAMRLGK